MPLNYTLNDVFLLLSEHHLKFYILNCLEILELAVDIYNIGQI